MSTTIKRIALVAVAALGLGVVAVAPSQAANSVLAFVSGDSAGADNTTGYGVAGPFNFVTLSTTSPAADYVVTTDSSFGGVTGSIVATADPKAVTGTGAGTLKVMTPAVGTVTVKYWVRTGGILAATAAESVVITVNATKQSGAFSAANSSAFIVAGETNTAVAPTADASVTGLATYNLETATGSIQVSLKDALKNAYPDTVTATVISGGAFVKAFAITDSTTAVTASASAQYQDSIYSSTGKFVFNVHASGVTGPTQVRLSLSDGTILGVKTVTFSSTTVATLTPTVVNAYVPAGSTKMGAVTVVAKDASGFVIPGASIAVTSSDTTKITSVTTAITDADGKASFTVGGVTATAGKVTLTFKSGVASTTADVTVAGVKATKIAVTTDVATAEAGSQVTYTLSVADANGPIADGVYNKFVLAPVTSNGGTGAFSSDTVTVVNGQATSSVYLPFVAGSYISTWTTAAASANIDAAIASTALTPVTVAVTNTGIDAATDAANEAAAAAQDATDAAISATDAAEEASALAQQAVDSVATLSAQVSKLITALKAQITTLSNLVAKIAKKVKA